MCIKKHYQQNEKTSTEWGKRTVNHIPNKGLISTIHQELLQLKKRKNSKRGKEVNRYFPKEDIQMVKLT